MGLYEHVVKVIQPALAAKKIVICDRFSDSTLAYQIGGQGLPEDFVRYLNMVAAQGLIPDSTFLLDLEPEIGLKRAGQKGQQDRFETENISFHQRVRAKFLELAENNCARIKVLDANQKGIEQIQKEIRAIVEQSL